VAAHPVEYLPDGTYLARMNLAGEKWAAPGHVVVRVIEYQADGGEVIRLLTDLLGPAAYPAAELAALYRQRREAESSYRQIKTFQRGPQQILRSAVILSRRWGVRDVADGRYLSGIRLAVDALS